MLYKFNSLILFLWLENLGGFVFCCIVFSIQRSFSMVPRFVSVLRVFGGTSPAPFL